MLPKDWRPWFVSLPITVCVAFATFFQVQGAAHLLHPLDMGQGVRGTMMGPGLQSTCCRALVLPLHGDVPGLANIVLVSAAAGNKSATRPPLPPPACGGEWEERGRNWWVGIRAV